MADLKDFKFDITDTEETPASGEQSGAPQFKPDFGAPQVPTASREEEGLPRNEFRMPLTAEQLPAKWKPLGAWHFFFYSLLYSLPLIGFICALIFSFAAKNLNARNYARSYFLCLLAGALVLGALFTAAWFSGLWQQIDWIHIFRND